MVIIPTIYWRSAIWKPLCCIYITFNFILKNVQCFCNHPVYHLDIGTLFQTVMRSLTSLDFVISDSSWRDGLTECLYLRQKHSINVSSVCKRLMSSILTTCFLKKKASYSQTVKEAKMSVIFIFLSVSPCPQWLQCLCPRVPCDLPKDSISGAQKWPLILPAT